MGPTRGASSNCRAVGNTPRNQPADPPPRRERVPVSAADARLRATPPRFGTSRWLWPRRRPPHRRRGMGLGRPHSRAATRAESSSPIGWGEGPPRRLVFLRSGQLRTRARRCVRTLCSAGRQLRQPHLEAGAVARLAVARDFAAVISDDRIGRRKAQPCSSLRSLRREEGLKHTCARVLVHAWTIVAHGSAAHRRCAESRRRSRDPRAAHSQARPARCCRC
jgi:hypothetical protein